MGQCFKPFRHQTIKLLSEDIREIMKDFGIGKDLLDKTPETQAMKARRDK